MQEVSVSRYQARVRLLTIWTYLNLPSRQVEHGLCYWASSGYFGGGGQESTYRIFFLIGSSLMYIGVPMRDA